jgi:hypothetical protein
MTAAPIVAAQAAIQKEVAKLPQPAASKRAKS